MADINRTVLVGRLTWDAKLAYTINGKAVSKFSIAVNGRVPNGETWKDEPSFFEIVLWGRQAESLNQYLVKGRMVGIDGELRQERWVQDGQNRSKVYVVTSSVQLMGGQSQRSYGDRNDGPGQGVNPNTGEAYEDAGGVPF
jgi:single-strand DNA-binding protein